MKTRKDLSIDKLAASLCKAGRGCSKHPQHTPGPWEYQFDNAGEIGAKTEVRVFGPDRHEAGAIARVCRLGKGGQFEKARELSEVKANARLIAAAPELLEALKFLVCKYENIVGLQATTARMKETIAKAEGK